MILVLAPHTDDAELGCGGSIARWVREGRDVRVEALTACGRDDLRMQFHAGMEALGVASYWCGVFTVRRFAEQRQVILDWLIRDYRSPAPERILCPSYQDAHQDHQVVAHEVFRAFRQSSIWHYELPWNHETFSTRAFVKLSEDDIALKLRALHCYKSQKNRPYFNGDTILGLARVRGLQIGTTYAEAFDVVREVR